LTHWGSVQLWPTREMAERWLGPTNVRKARWSGNHIFERRFYRKSYTVVKVIITQVQE
jgi:hypothetical protein